MKRMLVVFFVLQAADLGTTMWGLSLGGVEANALVAPLMSVLGPLAGLLLVKLWAAAVGTVFIRWGSRNAGRVLNSAFGLLVVWNLGQLAKVVL